MSCVDERSYELTLHLPDEPARTRLVTHRELPATLRSVNAALPAGGEVRIAELAPAVVDRPLAA